MFICVICEESLHSSSEQELASRDGPIEIVATRCGHVFHQGCILDWFESKQRNVDRENHDRNLNTVNANTCPTCQKVTNSGELIRLYPSEGLEEDAPDAVENLTKAEILSQNNKLKEELAQLNKQRDEDEAAWVNLFEALRSEKDDLKNQLEHLHSRESSETDESPSPISDQGGRTTQNRNSRMSLVKQIDRTTGGLNTGDPVVWCAPDAEHNGTVIWIGMIFHELIAAVKFVDPIGNTDGIINGKVRFDCDPDFTRQIPVQELILHKDFYQGAN